jgi:hypothetical protein
MASDSDVDSLVARAVDLRQEQTAIVRHVARTDFADSGSEIGGPIDGRVLGMLGPAASVSAGIVYAHFKTPMGVLIKHARRLLDDVAKRRFDRNAVAANGRARA